MNKMRKKLNKMRGQVRQLNLEKFVDQDQIITLRKEIDAFKN